MSNFMQLRTDHVELLDICQSLEGSIAGDTPPSSVDLFAVRKRLTAKLIAHLKAEDWLLYPRLLESEDDQVASTAAAFVEEMGGLAAAFNKYVESWDAFRIEREGGGLQDRDCRNHRRAALPHHARESRALSADRKARQGRLTPALF